LLSFVFVGFNAFNDMPTEVGILVGVSLKSMGCLSQNDR
jgi:hypothetical protein